MTDDNAPAVVVALQYDEFTDKRGEKLEGYGHAIAFVGFPEEVDTPVTPNNPTGRGKVRRCKATVPAWVARKLYDRPGSEGTWRVEYLPSNMEPAAPTGPPPGEHTIAGLRAKAKELGKAFPASVSKAEILAWLQEQESA